MDGVSALTRRSFLAAGAGVLAGGLARAPLAVALGAPPRRRERWLGELRGAGAEVALPRGADLVGLEWDAPGPARVELRLRGTDGRWRGWVSARGCTGSEEGAPASRARVTGAPVWSAGSDALQIRAAGALSGVRLHIIDASAGVGARTLARAHTALASEAALSPAPGVAPGQPAILARASWAQGMARPRVAPAYGAVRMAFVHHTQTPNGYLAGEVPAMLRSIFLYHRDVRGWNDIGYNFAIDAFGRIFEARAGGIDEPVVGAQAGGYNLVSTGVAMLGSFQGQRVSAAAARSLEALLAWKLSLHGAPARGRVRVRVNPAGAIYSRFPPGAHVSLARISGHRDGDSTDCPGDTLYGELPAVRRAVHALAPRPARAVLTLSRAPAPAAGQSPAQPEGASGAAALSGSLALLDGRPVVGAAIALQVRSVAAYGQLVRERTIAEARTDATGSWTLPLGSPAPARGHAWLRALYAGGGGEPLPSGAAVSEPLRVPAALIAALQALAPTPAASAPPAP
ncbi:MAG TPA: N-acetylmuramoyl-L-alanine amidase [Solirubrobacteraceae bacterium]|jgi:hypothetical protein|nr:N-acetylmuramoyl-L-alanine amidase [Solirubrobacteraceae bacterium]